MGLDECFGCRQLLCEKIVWQFITLVCKNDQTSNMLNHSSNYAAVIQLLEGHSFSSQSRDMNMKLYPYPGSN